MSGDGMLTGNRHNPHDVWFMDTRLLFRRGRGRLRYDPVARSAAYTIRYAPRPLDAAPGDGVDTMPDWMTFNDPVRVTGYFPPGARFIAQSRHSPRKAWVALAGHVVRLVDLAEVEPPDDTHGDRFPPPLPDKWRRSWS